MNQTTEHRFSQLDLLRSVAILLVFLRHFNMLAPGRWFVNSGPVGWIGVDLFFVLSGFLISDQLLRSAAASTSTQLFKFYIRRAFRIWPAYFLILFFYFKIPELRPRASMTSWWRFATFTQNFNLDYSQTGGFTHSWSLCVEEQFYLALPFLLLGIKRVTYHKRFLFIIFLSAIAIGMLIRSELWKLYLTNENERRLAVAYFREIYFPTYCRLDGLIIGMAIAICRRIYPALWSAISNRSNYFLGIGLLWTTIGVLVVEEKYTYTAVVFGFPILAVGFGGLVVAALSPQGIFSKVKLPGSNLGATLAFSFYLTHKAVIVLAVPILFSAQIAPESVAYPILIFMSCFLIATLLYYGIERPFLKIRDELLNLHSLHFGK